ncbi:phosphosulfolactate synthase [Halocella sp. SP3-1]|uniref:phosphosulfolactate synthase n=1 Tax=Halocella sp. SP3-1 TaxID=2382161 RepID=UPI000F75DBFB|nr:phosphosulfolactate synthase [Halocella sp. SP3-1]AZO93245.1 phosphosulfolactate synthase [Halocella sp. SP3-1]
MEKGCYNGWGIDISDPLKGRVNKPRNKGLTMVLDKGVGPGELRDILKIAGDYIDILKFTFGTSLLYPDKVLCDKIKIALEYNIDVYPGGTLFEVALDQSKINDFLFRAKQLGFTAVEISNGTIDISPKLRRETIYKANSLGFKVFTEVGKKDKADALTVEEMQYQIKDDISAGAYRIIIEGRESGRGVSIYHEDGSIDMGMVDDILVTVGSNRDVLLWEAPLKKQQLSLIRKLGSNVNLGNIAVDEVLALETLRRGLRGDTFKFSLKDKGIEDNRIKGDRVGA